MGIVESEGSGWAMVVRAGGLLCAAALHGLYDNTAMHCVFCIVLVVCVIGFFFSKIAVKKGISKGGD